MAETKLVTWLPMCVAQESGVMVLGGKPSPVTFTTVPTGAIFGVTVILGPDVAVICGRVICGLMTVA